MAGAVAIFLGSLLAAPKAAAGTPAPLPPDVAAIAQYRESLPTAAGPIAGGSNPKSHGSLPAAVTKALGQVSPTTRAALTEVATSSSLGAPSTKTPSRRPGAGKKAERPAAAAAPRWLDARSASASTVVPDLLRQPGFIVLAVILVSALLALIVRRIRS